MAGYRHVQQHKIETLVAHDIQRVLAIRRCQRANPFLLQHLDQAAPSIALVVHDEDALRCAIRPTHLFPPPPHVRPPSAATLGSSLRDAVT